MLAHGKRVVPPRRDVEDAATFYGLHHLQERKGGVRGTQHTACTTCRRGGGVQGYSPYGLHHLQALRQSVVMGPLHLPPPTPLVTCPLMLPPPMPTHLWQGVVPRAP